MDSFNSISFIVIFYVTINCISQVSTDKDSDGGGGFLGFFRNRDSERTSRWPRRNSPRSWFQREDPDPPPSKSNTMIGTLLAAGLIQLLGKDPTPKRAYVPASLLQNLQKAYKKRRVVPNNPMALSYASLSDVGFTGGGGGYSEGGYTQDEWAPSSRNNKQTVSRSKYELSNQVRESPGCCGGNTKYSSSSSSSSRNIEPGNSYRSSDQDSYQSSYNDYIQVYADAMDEDY